MTQTVSLPLWLLVLLAAFAAWAALDRLLVPGVRFFIRRRVNRVLEELDTRLPIRVQPFKLTKRQVLIDRLLYDPDLLAAMEEHARENDMPREVAMDKVRRYAEEIVPAFNAYVYFRLGYRIGRLVARSLYRVRLLSFDAEDLSRIDPRSTLVFVMNHRSNMDYILVAYLAASTTALSYAVGEWARVWPLQTLIRSMGAYFVRRRSRNPLYRRVLERYVHMATASGVTQAVYPEGGLSRDGSLQPPKLGLLDYMLRGFDPTGERDVVFIPVGINYDRVLEDRTLLRELDPEAPRVGVGATLGRTFAFLCRQVGLALRGAWYRHGYACVQVGSPVSVRAWLAKQGDLDLRQLPRDERFAAVERLGERLMEGVGKAIPAVPVAVAATVFLRHLEAGDEPMDSLEVKARIFEVQEELRGRGVEVYVPRRDPEYAAEVGLRMLTLRKLVEENGGNRWAAVPAEREVLAYYARSVPG